ncbi:YceI family protein [Pontixanthobacter sp.]|uniref:YceI family protein n=1 Tax=Pontixanthobacter sp. TaxID=2792078 RepID=UPI003C7ADAF1
MRLAPHLAAPLALLLLTAATMPLRYVVDSAGSHVSAKVGFFGIGSKTARFPEVSGTAQIAPGRLDTLALDVTINARALTAPDTLTLGRLKGEKFFWVEKYPTVRFTGNTLQMSGSRSGTVAGRLTARGVTQPVTLAVTFDTPPSEAKTGQPMTITGTTTINRRDFGMKSYSLIVGKNVDITLKAKMVPR